MKSKSYFLVVVLGLTLSGCAFTPRITTASPKQVIVARSWGTPASTQPVADAQCKRYDKNSIAVYRSLVPHTFANELVFDCVASN